MGLPNIVVEFIEKANTAIARSERGIVCLVVNDATKNTTVTTYRSITDIITEDWTAENLQVIKDAFHDGPTKVHIVRLGADAELSTVSATLDALKINWLALINENQSQVVEYIKARNAKKGAVKTKAVVHGAAADDIHIVNFNNSAVTRKGADATTAGHLYLGRIAGLLAALPLNKTATYYTFDDLDSVAEVKDADAAIDNGEFILINDYGTVRVARAVNSATTEKNGALKKITIIEGMDLIQEDIMTTFKEQYVGQYKNTPDNQALFIASVNTYFRTMAGEEVLNPAYNNLAEINVEKHRAALVKAGKTEALDWDDQAVKNNPYSSYIFVKGNVQFSDGIEDLDFEIYLN